VKENDNLKRLLLINHDFTSDLDRLVREAETKSRETERLAFERVKDAEHKLQEEQEERMLRENPPVEPVLKMDLDDCKPHTMTVKIKDNERIS
jgi:hypothetical protein